MREMTVSFKDMCNSFREADNESTQKLFHGIIDLAGYDVWTAWPNGTSLWVRAEKANIILEFQVNDSPVEAPEQVEEFRKDFFNNGTDVLCIGIITSQITNCGVILK